MRLRYGMVGGATKSYIGDVHFHAIQAENQADLLAGCFSRNQKKNQKTAALRNMPDPNRLYSNFHEMAQKEAQREDGIDFVVICTPNDSHYEVAKCFMEHGIDVVCEKPLAITVKQAEELGVLVKEKNIIFGMTYAYTGYAAIRQGREMIRNGRIGDILHVRVEHPEDWTISSIDADTKVAGWRYDPRIVGPSLACGDLGSHAEQMLVQFTGLHIKRVLAMFDIYPRNLVLETNATVLLDLGKGISGQLWASQIASGRECSPSIYVIGTEGSLEWHHERPGELIYAKRNGTIEHMTVGRSYMSSASNYLTRLSYGHPEGFFEAFSNIYRQYFDALSLKKQGKPLPETFPFPTITDGIAGQKFIAACVKSNQRGNVWVEV